MNVCCNFCLFVGRICISIIFLLAASDKLLDYSGTASYMASKGFTMIPFFLYGAALVELVGGLSILLGYKSRIGAILLLLYLIPVSYLFHDFWNAEAAARGIQQAMFFKNLAIFGGLLYVLGSGPGAISFDRFCCHTPSGTSS